jgi:Spy/CpxP family protein refolding chaperone
MIFEDFRMKHFSSQLLLILMAVILLSAAAANAQVTPTPDPAKQQFAGSPDQTRADMLAEIGLSPEQFQQLRQMNAERKPMVEAANKRLREANRALDQVIYGDAVDENEFRARLKEFQDAQADVARIRFENELTLRRVLTPDQLVKFRAIRQRIADARKARNQEMRALGQPNRPMRKFQQLPPVNRNQLPRKLP